MLAITWGLVLSRTRPDTDSGMNLSDPAGESCLSFFAHPARAPGLAVSLANFFLARLKQISQIPTCFSSRLVAVNGTCHRHDGFVVPTTAR